MLCTGVLEFSPTSVALIVVALPNCCIYYTATLVLRMFHADENFAAPHKAGVGEAFDAHVTLHLGALVSRLTGIIWVVVKIMVPSWVP